MIKINQTKGEKCKKVTAQTNFSIKKLNSVQVYFSLMVMRGFFWLSILLLFYILLGYFFLFTVMAKGKIELFKLIMSNNNYLLTWAIGYELLAILMFIVILKYALKFIFGSEEDTQSVSRRRRRKY